MLDIKEMTPEQRAVLRACEDKWEQVVQTEPPPPPKDVYVEVWNARDRYRETYRVSPDGSTGSFVGAPVRLYGDPNAKSADKENWGMGLPKHARKYVAEEQSRFQNEQDVT